jgi:hypothetical protein
MTGRPANAPDRRAFLALGSSVLLAALLAALLPRRARALGEATRLDIAQIELSKGTIYRPNAWTRLLFEVQQTTSVEVTPRVVRLSPKDPALFDHPISVLTGDGALPELDDEEAARLSRYLQYGGFLLADDTTGVEGGEFDRSFRAFCARIFPTRPLTPLPADHSIYRSFFLIRRPVGRLDRTPWLEGISAGEMTPLVYCRNDLSGALDRADDGRNRFPVVPGGERQRREAVKLGINLLMYALTSDYKKDIVHERQLMLDGRIE